MILFPILTPFCSPVCPESIINNSFSFAENNEGKTPLDISKGLGHTESIELVSENFCIILNDQISPGLNNNDMQTLYDGDLKASQRKISPKHTFFSQI